MSEVFSLDDLVWGDKVKLADAAYGVQDFDLAERVYNVLIDNFDFENEMHENQLALRLGRVGVYLAQERWDEAEVEIQRVEMETRRVNFSYLAPEDQNYATVRIMSFVAMADFIARREDRDMHDSLRVIDLAIRMARAYQKKFSGVLEDILGYEMQAAKICFTDLRQPLESITRYDRVIQEVEGAILQFGPNEDLFYVRDLAYAQMGEVLFALRKYDAAENSFGKISSFKGKSNMGKLYASDGSLGLAMVYARAALVLAGNEGEREEAVTDLHKYQVAFKMSIGSSSSS